MRYNNGNKTAMGAASDRNAPNCGEPTMNCDVGRKPWRSECYPLSLARSGYSVRYLVSLIGCRDIFVFNVICIPVSSVLCMDV